MQELYQAIPILSPLLASVGNWLPLVISELATLLGFIGYYDINRAMYRNLKTVSTAGFMKFALANVFACGLSLSKGAYPWAVALAIMAILGFITIIRNEKLKRILHATRGGLTMYDARTSAEVHGKHLGISIYDREGHLLEWTEGMQKLLGYTREEAMRMSQEDILISTLYPNEVERIYIKDRLSNLHTEGGYYVDIFAPKTRDHGARPIRYMTRVIIDRDNTSIGTFHVAFPGE